MYILHISRILNVIYPFAFVNLQGNCAFCKTSYAVEIARDNNYIGNVLSVRCDNCQQVNSVRIL